jgi:hypothetical protein
MLDEVVEAVAPRPGGRYVDFDDRATGVAAM